jgi:hypothetical protein
LLVSSKIRVLYRTLSNVAVSVSLSSCDRNCRLNVSDKWSYRLLRESWSYDSRVDILTYTVLVSKDIDIVLPGSLVFIGHKNHVTRSGVRRQHHELLN